MTEYFDRDGYPNDVDALYVKPNGWIAMVMVSVTTGRTDPDDGIPNSLMRSGKRWPRSIPMAMAHLTLECQRHRAGDSGQWSMLDPQRTHRRQVTPTWTVLATM